MKFTEQGGSITLEVSTLGAAAKTLHHKVVFEISDTGCGMSSEVQKRIFEPFFRSSHPSMIPCEPAYVMLCCSEKPLPNHNPGCRSAESNQAGGIGLGLAISSGMVSALGGDLCCESLEGEGTRFWFSLDMEEAECLPSNIVDREATRNLAGKQVLVVDGTCTLIGSIVFVLSLCVVSRCTYQP